MEEDKDVTIKSNVERLELYSDNYPFNLSLRIQTFQGEAEYNKFIKNCEKSIRGCLEYKLWRNYITDVLQVQSCAITNERMDQTNVDIHHHPVSLFTVVKALVNEKLEKEEPFCSFDICMSAIELHFKNAIGFTALLSDLHAKFHNGFLNIPRSLIKGNYKLFIEEYSKYLDEEDLEVIQSRLSITEHNCNWSAEDYPAFKEGIM
jgi:hypothetical protein